VVAGAEVLELGVAVGHGRVEVPRELPSRLRADLRREWRDDRLGSLVLDGIEHLVCDVVEGLVPGDLLELALAALAHALERRGHPIG